MRTINFKVQIKNEINPGEQNTEPPFSKIFQDMLINFQGISLEEKKT